MGRNVHKGVFKKLWWFSQDEFATERDEARGYFYNSREKIREFELGWWRGGRCVTDGVGSSWGSLL